MKLVAPLLLFPLFAATVHAGGIVPSQIDARARWIAHVDIEGFSDCSIKRPRSGHQERDRAG
jgi:hypothetical protein